MKRVSVKILIIILVISIAFMTGCEADTRVGGGRKISSITMSGAEIALSTNSGTYPRAYERSPGVIFGSFDSSDATNFILRSMGSATNGASWSDSGVVAAHEIDGTRTLGNAFPFELNTGRILCAFRHHDQVGTTYVYRLLVSYSDDAGDNWNSLSEIEVNSTDNGIWEPFLFHGDSGELQVYYAREHTIGGKQDIVMRRSTDSGATWGSLVTVASHASSRDGMPTVARMQDGTFVAIFEAFRNATRGPFVVKSVQSTDNGATWTNRQDVYVPADATKNAGAPYIVALADGRLMASFMTDEDSPDQNWPEHAAVKVLLSDGVPADGTLSWEETAITAVDASAHWPALTVLSDGDVLVLYGRGGPKARRASIKPL